MAVAAPLVRRLGRTVTTKEIAQAAEVAEGTIFYVFDDKDALIQAVVEREFRIEPVLAELSGIDPGAPLPARLVAIVEVLRRRLRSVFELMTALGMHRPPPPHDGAGPHTPHHDLLTALTTLLSGDAAMLRYPPAKTAELIRLFTFAASHPAITDNSPLEATEIVDVLLGGITTHPEGSPC